MSVLVYLAGLLVIVGGRRSRSPLRSCGRAPYAIERAADRSGALSSREGEGARVRRHQGGGVRSADGQALRRGSRRACARSTRRARSRRSRRSNGADDAFPLPDPFAMAERVTSVTGDLVVHAEGLGKSFGRAVVLRDVTLQCRGRRGVALFGPNGAGKSTLLRLLAALDGADDGHAARVRRRRRRSRRCAGASAWSRTRASSIPISPRART